ncbi:unnamed protein product [Bursaphelenchus okinawaensis]|uniref:SH2 domain-containing protein n=1 Tax=Bursaphelenchus okinawaensis TaxID=465554 RepID=A0A811JTF0_9BILA|nr:unnamed protein product [Bursaphelenchus okinawaensis]CAG9082100.1 unnamed protein product [Bursaphelenchus okinawaensis]
MGSLSKPEAITEAISQLDSSGITFSIEYVGNIAVKVSLNSKTVDMQNRIGEICIKTVAREAHKIDNDEQEDLEVSEQVLGALSIQKIEVDLNVTRKSLLIVDSNGIQPKVLQRLDIQNISIVVPGQDLVDDYFCVFAKCVVDNAEERRCFVFYAGEEKADVCRLLFLAFRTARQRIHSHSKSLTPSIDSNDNDKHSKSSTSINSNPGFHKEVDKQRFAEHDTNSRDFEKENFINLTRGLDKEPWYHGFMDRDKAETKVIRNNQFLVRESRNRPNQVILTGMQGSHVKHLCLIDATGKLRTTEREFSTVSALVRYFQGSLRPLSGDQSELILEEPVCRKM